MGKRKSTGKRARFEVFKRDEFTCRYCGSRPPGVILHVDHIVPVSKGGTDDLDNLATACQSCNAGKAAIPLGDKEPPLNPNAAPALKEQTEQMAEYRQWLGEFLRERAEYETLVLGAISDTLEMGLSDQDNGTVLKLVDELGLPGTLELARIARAAANRKGLHYGAMWKYFCGCCWTRIREAEQEVVEAYERTLEE